MVKNKGILLEMRWIQIRKENVPQDDSKSRLPKISIFILPFLIQIALPNAGPTGYTIKRNNKRKRISLMKKSVLTGYHTLLAFFLYKIWTYQSCQFPSTDQIKKMRLLYSYDQWSHWPCSVQHLRFHSWHRKRLENQLPTRYSCLNQTYIPI